MPPKNGLKVGTSEQSAEKQIEALLASPRANYKLALDVKNDINNYLAQAEVYLWPERDRRTPWKDVLMRAKTNPEWPWMPGSAGMDMLKTEALKQGRWRQGEDGYIEKVPFPKEKTTLNIAPQGTNKDSGESILTLTPRNCGASHIVHYSQNAAVSTADPVVDDHKPARLVDSKRVHLDNTEKVFAVVKSPPAMPSSLYTTYAAFPLSKNY